MHHSILTLSCQHKINRLCSNLVKNINNFQRINFPRYFRKSKRISKIETFIRQSKLGDWSVDVNMFLSRGGERGAGFWKYQIDYSELGGKGIQPIPRQSRAKLFLARNQSRSMDHHQFYHWQKSNTRQEIKLPQLATSSHAIFGGADFN